MDQFRRGAHAASAARSCLLRWASPGAPGNDYLWIVDYKTAAPTDNTDRDTFLASSREQYRSQLEAYSELFRKLPELDDVAARREHRLAIYHPMVPWLDWWHA